MQKELVEILPLAISISEDAAKIAYSYFRQTALLIEMKADSTPVTIADRKTEEYIRKALNREFSDHGVWGEEFGQESADREFVWTVDPIDGTRSFIRGIPLFGTLLALLQNGTPVLGVMVLPGLQETYSGGKGLGCYCNGQRIHCSATTSLDTAIVSHGDISCFDIAGFRGGLDKLMHSQTTVRGYTDCFGHSLVLRGALDAMIDPMVSVWDIAPIAALAPETGAVFFDLSNRNQTKSKGFVSCCPGLKDPLTAALAI